MESAPNLPKVDVFSGHCVALLMVIVYVRKFLNKRHDVFDFEYVREWVCGLGHAYAFWSPGQYMPSGHSLHSKTVGLNMNCENSRKT